MYIDTNRKIQCNWCYILNIEECSLLAIWIGGFDGFEKKIKSNPVQSKSKSRFKSTLDLDLKKNQIQIHQDDNADLNPDLDLPITGCHGLLCWGQVTPALLLLMVARNHCVTIMFRSDNTCPIVTDGCHVPLCSGQTTPAPLLQTQVCSSTY